MVKFYYALLNRDMFELKANFSGDLVASSSDSILVYVVQGVTTVTSRNQFYNLTTGDFLILNRGEIVTIKSLIETTIICTLYIPSGIVRDVIGSNNYIFICNSVTQSSMNHDPIRKMVRRIVYLSKAEIGDVRKNALILQTKSVYFELIDLIIQKYLEYTSNNYNSNNNFASALDYIHQNYYKKISLDEVAQYGYMSKSYFSRYFKKEMGINFVTYLKQYRVKQSLSLLSETEYSITQVALEVGFSSTSSFNIAFKELYSITPTDYRKNSNTKPKYSDESVKINEVNLLDPEEPVNKSSPEVITDYINNQFSTLSQIDIRMSVTEYMNVGNIKNLIDGKFQNHLKTVTKSLDLKGLIISNVFDEIIDHSHHHYTYQQYKTVFDFIIESKLKAIFQIPINDRSIKYISKSLESFLKYLLGSYNIAYLGKVNFNLDIDLQCLDQETVHNTCLDVIQIIRRYFGQAQIGAPNVDIYSIRDYISKSKQLFELDLDFVSCTFFDRDATRNRLSLEEYIKLIKKEVPLDRKKLKDNIYITEYNTSQSIEEKKNYSNDSILKAAQVVNDLINMIGLVNVVAYYPISDFLLDYIDEDMILDGGGGLLASNGLYKPVFFSFKFMRHLGKWFLDKSNNYIATRDENNNITILSNNYNKDAIGKEILKNYEMMRNTSMLNKGGKKVLRLTINDMKDGIYEVRTYSINESQGNILYEWSLWDYIDYSRRSDIDYLKNLANPNLMIRTIQINNSVLYLDIEMKSNEISITYIDYIAS